MSWLGDLAVFAGFVAFLGLTRWLLTRTLRKGQLTRAQASVLTGLVWASLPWYLNLTGTASLSVPVLLWISLLTFVSAAVAMRLLLDWINLGVRK